MTLKPPRFIGTMEFAERFVSLDGIKFDRRKLPQMELLAELADRRRDITILALFPPQVFKTLWLQLTLTRDASVCPVRTLWYSPTGKDAGDISDEKLYPLMESLRSCMEKFAIEPDARGGKKLFKFHDAPVSMYSADVKSHRNSRSGVRLLLDEAWQYKRGYLKEIFQRADDAKWRRSHLLSSTGPTEDDDVDTIHKKSSRHEWHWRCVTCGERVLPEFGEAGGRGGLVWDSNEFTRHPDGRWKPEIAKLTTRWVCPLCERPHKYSSELLRQLSDPDRGAEYVQMNPAPDPKTYGVRAEAVVFRDWEELVGEWLEAINAKRLGNPELVEDFTRKKKVKPWNPMSLIVADKNKPYGDYNMGDPWPAEGKDPQGRPLRVLFVDVQQNCFWAVARQWSNLPGTWAHSRLLHFERLVSGGQIEDLRKKLNIPPERVVLDCAYDPAVPRQIASTWGYRTANAEKPRDFLHQDGIRRIYSEPRRMDPFLGKAQQGNFYCLEFLYSSNGAKYRLEALRQSKDANGKPFWTIPRIESVPKQYVEQAWAEKLIRKRHPKGGWFYEWKRLIDDNHAFDMEAGQVVYASMMGLLGADSLEPAESEPEKKTAPAPT